MLISRGANLLKNVVTKIGSKKTGQNVMSVRNSGQFFYRDIPKPHKYDILAAELFGGFMWWWILWHMYHDIGHVIGEYDYPDPSKWTDEELGIPPED